MCLFRRQQRGVTRAALEQSGEGGAVLRASLKLKPPQSPCGAVGSYPAQGAAAPVMSRLPASHASGPQQLGRQERRSFPCSGYGDEQGEVSEKVKQAALGSSAHEPETGRALRLWEGRKPRAQTCRAGVGVRVGPPWGAAPAPPPWAPWLCFPARVGSEELCLWSSRAGH